MKSEVQSYDAVIVGGGMAGSSLALLLEKAMPDLRIALVEALSLSNNEHTQLPSYDDRSSALSLGSCEIYQRLGIWQSLQPHMESILSVHVSDRGHPGGTFMDGKKINTSRSMPSSTLGYVIENRLLGSVLLAQIKQSDRITLIDNTRVKDAHPKAGCVEMGLQESGDSNTEHTLHTSLMIVADGAESSLRKQLGIASEKIPYGQAAIIANVTTSAYHQHTAYERFTDSGPMALLPLPDYENEHRCALVWTIDEAKQTEMSGLSDKAFLAELQQRFGNRLGFFTRVGQRSVYPLSLHRASEQVRSRIVLMGNAAHSMHPVAGQGFNLSLRDCDVLTQILQKAHSRKCDMGSLAVLTEYEMQQQQDQDTTIGASHLLTHLFSTDFTPAAFARNAGLFGLDFLPGIKQWFARHAMGLGGKSQGGSQ